MAEVALRPLLAQIPERTPPRRWWTFMLPMLVALVGIVLANIATIQGQKTPREIADLEKQRDVAALQAELSKARLDQAPLTTLNRLESQLSATLKRGYAQGRPPGRQFTWWDAYRYEEIIDQGYLFHGPDASEEQKASPFVENPNWPEHRLKNVVWYPLYPAMGAAVKFITGLGPYLFDNANNPKDLGFFWGAVSRGLATHTALTLVAQTCAVLAAALVFIVARRHFFNRMPELGEEGASHVSRRWDISPMDTAALWTVAFLFFGPCSIFLYANYTESLFVLLLSAFLFCVQSRWWWRAALVAAVASACRSQGALFGPVLFVTFLLRANEKNTPVRVGTAVALGLISLIGLASYMTFLGLRFGNPLAFTEGQRYWNVGINSATVFHALNPVHGMTLVFSRSIFASVQGVDWPRLWEALSVVIPPVVLMLLGARFLSFELELLGWLMWGLPYVSNSLAGNPPGSEPWISMGRFMAVTLPLHLVLGAVLVRFRWLGPILMAFSAALFALFSYRFGGGGWVG